MSDSGRVIGENNPYHSNFSGSYIDELASRDEQITNLRAKLAEAERELKASEQERDDVLAKFVQQSEKHRAEAAEARVRELEEKLETTEGNLASYKMFYHVAINAKLAAVREQYDRWMAERQGFIQTLMTIGDLVKE